MAKKSARVDLPYTCAKCGRQLWLETNTTNNTVKGVKKLELKKYCPSCRVHTDHTQTKPPSKVQQGGKKKR